MPARTSRVPEPGPADKDVTARVMLDAWRRAPDAQKPIAMGRLIDQFRPMVSHLLNRMGVRPGHPEYDDLLQESLILLMQYLGSFDPTRVSATGRPVRIITYVMECIRCQLNSRLTRKSPCQSVRIPAYMMEVWSKIQRYLGHEEYLASDDPIGWLAEKCHEERHVMQRAVDSVTFWRGAVSSDAMPESMRDIADSTYDPAVSLTPDSDLIDVIHSIAPMLHDRDMECLFSWADGSTLDQIAQGYGVSRESVRQRISRCVRRIRKALSTHNAAGPVRLAYARH